MISSATRRVVRNRAGRRCEYCKIPEDHEPFSFHVEHIVPKKHGGDDDPSNLGWSCHHCNLAKSSNLAGWLGGQIVPLFNPRRQNWNRHFRWEGPVLIGRTKCGRATIRVLNVNDDDRIELRKLLVALGEFPGD